MFWAVLKIPCIKHFAKTTLSFIFIMPLGANSLIAIGNDGLLLVYTPLETGKRKKCSMKNFMIERHSEWMCVAQIAWFSVPLEIPIKTTAVTKAFDVIASSMILWFCFTDPHCPALRVNDS